MEDDIETLTYSLQLPVTNGRNLQRMTSLSSPLTTCPIHTLPMTCRLTQVLPHKILLKVVTSLTVHNYRTTLAHGKLVLSE